MEEIIARKTDRFDHRGNVFMVYTSLDPVPSDYEEIKLAEEIVEKSGSEIRFEIWDQSKPGEPAYTRKSYMLVENASESLVDKTKEGRFCNQEVRAGHRTPGKLRSFINFGGPTGTRTRDLYQPRHLFFRARFF